MSNRNIDDRIVAMRFDNDQFEKGIRESLGSLENFKKQLDFEDAARSFNSGMDQVIKAAKDLDKSFNFDSAVESFSEVEEASKKVKFTDLSNVLDTVAEKFSIFGTIADQVLRKIGDLVWDLTSKVGGLVKGMTIEPVSEGWRRYENELNYVQQIMNATNRSESDIYDNLIHKIDRFSDETSYSSDEILKQAASIMTYGYAAEDAIKATEGLAVATAYSGKSNSSFLHVAEYTLLDIINKGLNKMDIRQLAGAGVWSDAMINTFIEAGEEAGVIEKGSVTIENFMDTLGEEWDYWSSGQVAINAFGKWSERIDEAIETADAWNDAHDWDPDYYMSVGDALEAMGDATYDYALKGARAAQTAKTFTESIDAIKDAAATGWKTTFRLIVGYFHETKEEFSWLTDELYTLFVTSAEIRNGILEDWYDAGGMDSLHRAFHSIWDNIVAIINTVKSGITDIFPYITGERLAELTEKLADMMERLTLSDETLENIKQTVRGIASFFKMIFQIVGALIRPIFGIAEGTSSVFGSVFEVVTTVTAKIGKKIEDLSKSEGFQSFIGFLNNVGETIRIIFADFGGIITDVIGNFGKASEQFKDTNKIFTVVIGVLAILRNSIIYVIDLIGNLLNVDTSGFKNGVVNLFYKFATLLGFIWDKLSLVKTNLVDLFKGVFGSLKGLLNIKGDSIISGLTGTGFDLLTNVVQFLINTFGDLIGIDLSKFGENVTETLGKVKDVFVAAGEAVDGFLVKAKESGRVRLSEFIGDMALVFKGYSYLAGGGGFGGVVESVLNSIIAFVRLVVNIFGDLTGLDVSWLEDKLVPALWNVRDSAVEFAHTIEEKFSGLKDKMQPVFDWLGEKFEFIKDKLSGIFGKSKWEIDLDAEPLEMFSLNENIDNMEEGAGIITRLARKIGELKRRGEGLGTGPVGLGARVIGGLSIAQSNVKQDNIGAEAVENATALQKAFKFVGDIYDKIKEDLGPKIEEFKKWFREKRDTILSDGGAFYDKVKEKFQPIIDFFTKFAGLLHSVWVKYLKPVLEETIKWFNEKMDEWKQKIDDSEGIKAGDILKAGGIIGLILYIFKQLSEIPKDKGGLLEFISDKLHPLEETLERFQSRLQASAIKDIAIAVAILAGSLLVLTLINPDKLATATLALGEVFGTIEALMWSMAGITNVAGGTSLTGGKKGLSITSDGFKSIATAMIEMAIAVAILSGALVAIANASEGKNMTELAMTVGELGMVLMMMLTITSKVTTKDSKATSLVAAGLAMIMAAKAIQMMMKPVRLLAGLNQDEFWQAMLGITIITGALSLIFVSLAKLNTSKTKKGDSTKIIQIGAAVLMVATALMIIVIAVATLAKVATSNPEGFKQAVIAMAAMLASIVVVLVALTVIGKKLGDTNAILKVGGAILMVAGSLAVVALAIAMLAKGLSGVESGSAVAAVGILAVALLAISAVLGGLAIIAKKVGDMNSILKVAGAIAIVSLSLVVVAKAISMLAGFEWGSLLAATGAIVLVFGGLVASFVILTKTVPDSGKLVAVAGALALGCVSIMLVAASISTVAKYDWQNLLAATIAIVTVFGGIAAALGILASLPNASGGDLAATAASLLLASLAILAIGGALSMLAQLPVNQIIAAGVAVAIVLGGLTAAFILLTMYSSEKMLLAIGGAFALVGAGALMAGAGFKLVCDGIAELVQLGPEALAAIEELAGYFIGQIPNIIKGFAEGFLIEVPKVLLEALPTLSQALIELIFAMLNVFSTTLPKAIETLWEFIWAVLDSILVNIKNVVITVNKIIIAVLEGLIETIGPLVEKLIELVCEIIKAVGGELSLILQTLVQFVIDLINALADTIENKAVDFYEAIKHLIVSIIKAIGAIIEEMINDFIALGHMIMDSGFVKGLGEKIVEVASKAKEIFDEFKQNIEDKINEIFEIGRNVVQGFIDGVTDFLGNVAECATGLWNKFKDTFTGNKNADVNSPSKATEKWGNYLVEGLVKGVNKDLGMAENSATDLAQGFLSPLSSAMAMASQIVEEEDFGPVITPVLDLADIQNGVGTLGNMLSDRTLDITGKASMTESRTNGFMNDVVGRLNDLSSQGNNSYNVSISINARDGQSARDIAEEVKRQFTRELNQRGAAYR